MLRKRPMKLSTTVILMVSAVLFSVLLVVHLVYFSQISDMTRDGLANKALAVARTLADSPEIRQGLQKKPQESGIQDIAEAVRKRNDLLFIVVTDMQSLRYSHPETQRIGQLFKGDDILKALNGEENVAINRGFLAQALRVFTPIYDENHKQIGVVAIGLELSRVTQQINDSRWSIIWSILFGVLVGGLGTWILVKVLKRILFGLEPYEISTLFEQRQAMLQSIKEGVVAVDARGEVTLINDAAQELLNYQMQCLGNRPDSAAFVYDVRYAMDGYVRKAGPHYVLSAGKLLGEQTLVEGKERKRSADIYMSAPRTFQWNITVNLPAGYEAAAEGVEKLNVKVENECGAFIAKAVAQNGKLILDITKRYNHKTEPATNWDKLLEIQDASKAYESLSVVLKK